MKSVVAGFLAAGALLSLSVSPATATVIPNGSVSSVDNFNPTIAIGTTTSSYGANKGPTYETSATGGFVGASGLTGTLNGTLTFSNTPNETINQVLKDFFVFNDGAGGTFNFSLSSVLTRDFANNPNITTSGTLYLLGSTIDTIMGYDTPTATSLTVSFNSTGGSAYSSSLTLAVPPAPLQQVAVSEPMSLALLGTALVGLGMVRRARGQEAV